MADQKTTSKTLKPGYSRYLTDGEKTAVWRLFPGLRVANIRIVYGKVPHPSPLAVAQSMGDGSIYFRENIYREDFSNPAEAEINLFPLHVFIHEVCHQWQFQLGYSDAKIFQLANEYKYKLDGNRPLDNYGFEQQCDLLADYYLLKTYGNRARPYLNNKDAGSWGEKSLRIYTIILADFLKSPWNKKLLPCNDVTQLSCQP